MAEALQAWSTDPEGCEFTAAGRRVRPLLLVPAEGGGIRAAYWTVRGLEAIGEKTCAGRSVLFSAGASGGSVGLTVARFSGTATDPGITRAVEAVQQMAGPGTLSEAADGTFIGDIKAATAALLTARFPCCDRCAGQGALRWAFLATELSAWLRPPRRVAALLRGRVNAPAVWAQMSRADILSA